MAKYSHLLFDADHTIFDFEKSQNRSLQLAFTDLGIPSKPVYFSSYDRINKQAWLDFERGKIDRKQLVRQRATQFQSIVEEPFDPFEFHDCYKHHLSEQVDYFDHAFETLHELAGTYTLAMITNGLAPIQKPRLAKSGIEHLFDVIAISGEIGLAKPDIAYFNYTFEALNNPSRDECLVIGDNLVADIQGGINAGCDTCWIDNSRLRVTEDIRPTYKVRDWKDIRNLLIQSA